MLNLLQSNTEAATGAATEAAAEAATGGLGRILDALIQFGPQQMNDIGPLPFLVLLVFSFCSSMYVSYLYVVFYSSRATGSQIHRAFPLLALSITSIFICIQFSLPLSLGLLGALSIVRFRTPIKEPEEIGFLMLVIATSLCCATANLLFLGVILAVGTIGLLVVRFLGQGRSDTHDGLLTVVLDRAAYLTEGGGLLNTLGSRLKKGQIDGVVEVGDEVTVSYRFRRLPPEGVTEIQNEITGLIPGARTSVYYLQSSGA